MIEKYSGANNLQSLKEFVKKMKETAPKEQAGDKDKKSRGNSNSQSFFVHFSKVHNFLTYCDCVHRIRLENFCNLKVNFDSIL